MRLGRWFVLSLVVAFAGISATAHAAVFNYQTPMDGPSESPANASPGTGFASLLYDDVAHTMRIQANFTGLTGTTTMAHIHAPTVNPFTLTAGVATQLPSFSGFPLAVTAGSMDTTFDMTLPATWNSSYITANGGTTAGAEAAFASHLAQGRAYFNIHTSTFNGGEIRGFFRLIPEPATLALAAVSAMALAVAGRRARNV
jgi:hypothetical protein